MKKVLNLGLAVASLDAALALAPGAAQASRALGTITGVVTAAPTVDRIVVDGRAYRIAPGSAAATERNGVRAGQTVDIVLAPQSSGATGGPVVIGITVHRAPAP